MPKACKMTQRDKVDILGHRGVPQIFPKQNVAFDIHGCLSLDWRLFQIPLQSLNRYIKGIFDAFDATFYFTSVSFDTLFQFHQKCQWGEIFQFHQKCQWGEIL